MQTLIANGRHPNHLVLNQADDDPQGVIPMQEFIESLLGGEPAQEVQNIHVQVLRDEMPEPLIAPGLMDDLTT